MVLATLGWLLLWIGAATGATDSGVLPAIRSFLGEHPEFGGEVLSVQDMADWASGKRQRLRLEIGTYVFYEQDGEVVSVYRTDDGRDLAWRKPGYEPPSAILTKKQGARAGGAGLPGYEVIEAIKLLAGGVSGDVLMESMSRATPVEVREQALRRITEKEGFTEASMYCSRDAFRANVSASFARSHPNALRECFLGSLHSGRFIPGEALYP